MERAYIAIDLKSFYASVECAERGLDPLRTNLVVADESRTEKTICLAVSPSLKAYGLPGRCRLFEVIERVKSVNAQRRLKAPGQAFRGQSSSADELAADPSLSVSYLVAEPRMALYMEYSARIYQIYLRSIAPEDIHVYSVDEVFIDATAYLKTYGLTAHGLAMKLIHEVLQETGITATAGVATNMYLCKVAMDIVAKHIEPDADGVRIAELDERSYREQLWDHRPLTAFWRVGKGTARKLEANGMYTMGDVARVSVANEELLYRLFGVNAELLIDHAWGWEPCTIADIKAYVPQSNSLSQGQVLSCAYTVEQARIIIREMAEQLALDLVGKSLVTDQLVLTVCYDPLEEGQVYRGPMESDWYGRQVPRASHGSRNMELPTSSSRVLTAEAMALYDSIAQPGLPVRRIYIAAEHVIREDQIARRSAEQLDLFTDWQAEERRRQETEQARKKEKLLQLAELTMREKYGRSAVFKAAELQEGSTALERGRQIGGHKA